MILSESQIREVTQRKQYAAQARVLTALGIKYAIRPDGSLVVAEAAVDALLNPSTKRKIAIPEPDWGAVR